MRRWLGLGFGLCLILQGCSDMDQSLRELKENTVRIGGLVTLTGALGRDGRGILYAGKLAAREINEQGGVNGQQIEIIEEDDQIKSSSLLLGARELEALGVIGVLGSVASSMTLLAAEQVFIPAGIPMVSASSSSPKISQLDDRGLVWRTAPSDAYQGEFLANQMWKRGIRRASVIYIDNAYGSGLANRFQEVFKGIGGSVVQSVSYPSDKQKDFGNEVQTALQGLVDADALVILGYDSDSAAIGFALDSANPPKLSYWGCDGNFTSGFLANSPISLLRGIKGSGFRTTSGDRYETFVAQYQAATRSKVEAYSAHAYDAIYLMALALARSETNTKEGLAANLAQISSGAGAKVYPGEFAKAVELLKQGTAIDYSGVSGEVDFDGNGDVKIDSNDLEKFYYIWRVKDDLSGFEEDKN